MSMKFALLAAASIAFAANAHARSGDGAARMMVGARVVAPCEISSDRRGRSEAAAHIAVTCANPALSYEAVPSSKDRSIAIALSQPHRQRAIERADGDQYAIEEISF